MLKPQPVIVVDILREVAQAVSDKMSEPDSRGGIGRNVQYLHGHVKEIEQELIQMTKAPAVKYPLIVVFQDFPVKRGGEFYGVVTFPSIIIAMLTDRTYKAPKRYEVSFKPYLYPIYQEYMHQLKRHKSVVNINPNHTVIDRLYWGTEAMGAQLLTDAVDAIEIQNLAITLKQHCAPCA